MVILSLSAFASWNACRDHRYTKHKYSHKMPTMHFTYHLVKSKRKMPCTLAHCGLYCEDQNHCQILCPFFDTPNPNCTHSHINPIDFPTSEPPGITSYERTELSRSPAPTSYLNHITILQGDWQGHLELSEVIWFLDLVGQLSLQISVFYSLKTLQC